MLLSASWSALFCYVLDAVLDSSAQWLFLALLVLACPILAAASALQVHCLEKEALARDEYDVDAAQGQSGCPLDGTVPAQLKSEKPEQLDYHARVIIAPHWNVLKARRRSLALFVLLALQQTLSMVLFARHYPALCTWTSLEAQSPLSGAWREVAGGDVDCARERHAKLPLIGQANTLELAIWLPCCLPILWALMWYSNSRDQAHAAACTLLSFLERRQELLLSPTAAGHQFFAASLNVLWMSMHEMSNRACLAWWVSCQLVIDAADCVDMWFMVATDPRVFLPRIDGAPSPWEPDVVLRSNDTSGLVLSPVTLWLLTMLVLSVATATVVASPCFDSLTRVVNEVHISEHNLVTILAQFADRQLPMPSKNREAAMRSLRAVLMLDLPFLVIRALVAHGLQVRVSPFAAKNLVCLAYHVATGLRFQSWKAQVGSLLRGRHALRADDHKGAASYEARFLAAYCLDLLGLPVTVAATAETSLRVCSTKLGGLTTEEPEPAE